MKINFKYVFLGVAIIAAFLLGHQCGPTKSIETPGKTITIHTSDTIYQDTGSVKFKDRPYPVPYYVEVSEPKDTLALKEAYAIRMYKEIYEDSTIAITVKDSILGYLTKQNVSYKMKGIKQINTNTSSTITINVPTPMKYQVSLGLEASPLGLSFGGQLDINRSQYGFMYDPFNKTPYISYKYIVFRK